MEELIKEILVVLKSEKPQKITFTVNEAAEYTGIGQAKIRELTERPNTDFPFFRIGKRVNIDKSALDRWIDKITEEHRDL